MGPSELSGLMPYSALGYSGAVITGISGSALGGTDSATVSAIASSYAESAASSKVDKTAMSGYVPVSAVSSWSSQIAALGSAVSSLSAMVSSLGPVYELRAGNGLYVSSDSSVSATEIGLV